MYPTSKRRQPEADQKSDAVGTSAAGNDSNALQHVPQNVLTVQAHRKVADSMFLEFLGVACPVLSVSLARSAVRGFAELRPEDLLARMHRILFTECFIGAAVLLVAGIYFLVG